MKRKILGVPVIVILCVLGIVLASGIGYAAVSLFGGGASVAVSESISTDWVSGPAVGSVGTVVGDTWYCPLYPGEMQTCTPIMLNNASATATVVVNIAVVPGGDYSADGISMVVDDLAGLALFGPCVSVSGVGVPPGAGADTLTLTVQASNGAVPGIYAFTINITR